MLTREYVVRGDNPTGPRCPGAVLFSIAGVGTGESRAVAATGSGKADPIATESFRIRLSHVPYSKLDQAHSTG